MRRKATRGAARGPAHRTPRLRPAPRGRGRTGIHQVGIGHLLDFLSEMLAIQKNSIQLLELAKDRSASPDMREWMESAIRSIEERADELRTAIRDLGANPVFVSPAAEIQHQRAAAARGLEVPGKLQALVDVENCWYSALQESVHLSFLRSVMPFLDSVHAREALEGLLEKIAREHDERLEWLEQTLHRLLLQRAITPTNGNDWYRAA